MAVLDAQQLGAHLLETAGFLPQLGRLDHRHGQFDGAGAVHFLAHDGFDLADHAQAHGHMVVDAGTQLLISQPAS
jgi:hypothetical protein